MQGMHDYLQQMVERSSAALVGKDGKAAAEGLLFLGNPQLVFPRLLFEDPVLEPVDRNVWAAIKLHAADGDSVTAFPSYQELMLRCNVRSKSTISRSISILRSTRWLSVCKARLRDAKGRVRGNIYALHDEPLQLVETMGLDSHYLEWMQQTAQGGHNPHPRAKAIATSILQDMQEQVQAGEDITQLEMPIPRRSRALAFNAKDAATRFFTLPAASIAAINGRGYLKNRIEGNVQNLYPVGVALDSPSTESVPSGSRNCTEGGGTDSVPRSISSKYYKNTTTTKPTAVTTGEVGMGTDSVLAWPDAMQRLDPNNRALVRMQLQTVPKQHQQPVMDALAVKLADIATGKAQPLRYGILPYTRKLCELAAAGKLNPVAVPIPKPSDPSPTTPSNADALPRELRALECELSNLSSEVRHLEQLGKAGGFVPKALESTKDRWKLLSQRHRELKQAQGQVLH